MGDARRQYLERHAEPEAQLAARIDRRYGHVLTIPAAGEGPELQAALASIPDARLGTVLTIVVVNGRADSPEWIGRANRDTLAALRAQFGPGQPLAENATLCERGSGSLLIVDRATPGHELPARQGVGLARKIAADLALALWDAGSIQSAWIHCSDADVRLPVDYFDRSVEADAESGALVYPYRHVAPNGGPLGSAALGYEISLRYYVRGLQFAASPFAFATIGSTLAVRADAYAQARGFPRRLAAEDFYLLNKLAKIRPVQSLAGEPIELSARESTRTPFGTGRAIVGYGADETRELYHPDVFAYLGAWEQALLAISRADEPPKLHDVLRMSCARWPNVDPTRLARALERIGADRSTIARAKDPTTRLRQLHDAFDAARTLKLIHALRDFEPVLASLPLHRALRAAPFVPDSDLPGHPGPWSGRDLERAGISLGC